MSVCPCRRVPPLPAAPSVAHLDRCAILRLTCTQRTRTAHGSFVRQRHPRARMTERLFNRRRLLRLTLNPPLCTRHLVQAESAGECDVPEMASGPIRRGPARTSIALPTTTADRDKNRRRPATRTETNPPPPRAPTITSTRNVRSLATRRQHRHHTATPYTNRHGNRACTPTPTAYRPRIAQPKGRRRATRDCSPHTLPSRTGANHRHSLRPHDTATSPATNLHYRPLLHFYLLRTVPSDRSTADLNA